MGRCPIRCRQDIAAQVIGVGPGLAAACSGKQLVQVIVGLGVGGAVFRIGKDIAQLVIGVAVAGSICKAGARQRTVPCLVMGLVVRGYARRQGTVLVPSHHTV